MCRLIIVLALLCIIVSVSAFTNNARISSSISRGSSFRLAAELSVEERLQAKLEAKAAQKAGVKVEAKKVEAKKVETKVEVKKYTAPKTEKPKVVVPPSVKTVKPVELKKTVETVKPVEVKKTVETVKPVELKKTVETVKPVELKKTVETVKPVEVKKTVSPVSSKTTTSVQVESNAIPTGIAIGSAPYLVIALLAAGAVGGFKKPKPISGPKITKGAFTKPINVGAKEGIDELLSGKVTEELELSRKGIKLSLAGFGAAAAGAALLIASQSKPEVKEIKTNTSTSC